jgi:hypothetical protein
VRCAPPIGRRQVCDALAAHEQPRLFIHRVARLRLHSNSRHLQDCVTASGYWRHTRTTWRPAWGSPPPAHQTAHAWAANVVSRDHLPARVFSACSTNPAHDAAPAHRSGSSASDLLPALRPSAVVITQLGHVPARSTSHLLARPQRVAGRLAPRTSSRQARPKRTPSVSSYVNDDHRDAR